MTDHRITHCRYAIDDGGEGILRRSDAIVHPGNCREHRHDAIVQRGKARVICEAMSITLPQGTNDSRSKEKASPQTSIHIGATIDGIATRIDTGVSVSKAPQQGDVAAHARFIRPS